MSEPPGDSARPARRVRYRGKNPRAFSERYKERNPERFPETIQKVLASGKTPAGDHIPILVDEILERLAPAPGEVAIDATIGHGGHAAALLPRLLPGGRLLGMDVDPLELPRAQERLRASGMPDESFMLKRMNYAGLPQLLADEELAGADLILADLGVSSMQLDDPHRGFSYKREGPFDLRMNPALGEPAWKLLERIPKKELEKILVENSDEPHAVSIADALVKARSKAPLRTTSDVAAAVRAALATLSARAQKEEGDSPIRRTFQALRILVNEEFSALEDFLRALPDCLNPGGRVAILTFHSGEDRRVKKAFQRELANGVFSDISRDVIRAGPDERYRNPRSSPAKLRWAIKGSRGRLVP